ncbi:GNAT family N-acetyltransferase [Streptomyces mirabilis]|uniref:GNAT family N-acetyltransferase n=1 Tax=Streptomyces mirabilis TaxID=68239 RepID=UPI00365EDF6E
MRWRAVKDGDIEEIFDLFGRSEHAAIGRRETTRADVRDLLASPGLYVASRTMVVESKEGRLSGLVALHPAPQAGQLRAHLVLAPADGATDTARALLHLLDKWVLKDALDVTTPVTMFQLPNCPAHDLIAAEGWTIVHSYTRLSIDLGTTEFREPAQPPLGVRLRFAADDQDRRAVHSVLENALAGHWNHRRHTFAEFDRDQRQRDGYDPALWWLAEVDGSCAGAVIARDPSERAWIAWLGVLDAYRGGGIGTQLLRTVFRLLRDRGHHSVGVDVDTHNTVGALNVYRAAGMSERGTADQWCKTYAQRPY